MVRIAEEIVSVSFPFQCFILEWVRLFCFAVSILVIGLSFWKKVNFLLYDNIIISSNYLLSPFSADMLSQMELWLSSSLSLYLVHILTDEEIYLL